MFNGITLAQFLRDRYFPIRQCCPKTQRNYQLAINSLDAWHGAHVQLPDLTEDLVNRWIAAMGAARAHPKTIKNRRGCVLAVWNFAATRKLCRRPKADEIESVALPKSVRPIFQQKDLSGARRNSLLRYFHQVYYPETLAHLAAGTARQYELAVQQLCLFRGHDVTLAEVNETIVDRFAEWCIATKRIRYETARHWRISLRAIMRHARPEKFPKRSGRPRSDGMQALPPAEETDGEGTLLWFLRERYRPARLVARTDVWADQIKHAIRRLEKQLGRRVLLADLTDDLLESHQGWMLDNGYSPSTVNSACGAILALWRFAWRKRLAAELPRVSPVPEYRRLPTAWTVEEFARLLDATDTLTGEVCGIPRSQWWRALLLVIFDTGIRRRAAFGIERTDVDLQSRWLRVPAELMKTKVEQRFRLSEQTVRALERIWSPPRKLLFPRTGKCQAYGTFATLLERAGLPNDRRSKFHKIRRTTATLVAKSVSIDAAVHMLGHTSETMTRRYIDPCALAEHDVSQALPRPEAAEPTTPGRKMEGGAA